MHERCRTAVTSASFTPLATFRLQSFSTAAFLSVDVDITFHHIKSQFSMLISALLSVVWRCSQISLLVAYLSVGSHNVQPSTAINHNKQQQQAQVAKPQGRQSHPITLYNSALAFFRIFFSRLIMF